MEDTFYFSHDYGARNDPKLQRLMMVHGLAGIGAFWCMIELLYEQGGRLKLDDTEMFAFTLRCDVDFVKSLINDFGLFANDGVFFWSESVTARMKKRNELVERNKKAAMKRWGNKGMQKHSSNGAKAVVSECKSTDIAVQNNSSCNAKTMQDGCKTDANAMQVQCKDDASAYDAQMQDGCKTDANAMLLKERKGKEIYKENNPLKGDIKEKAASRFLPPTLDEIKAYIQEKGYSMSAERFFDFYESKGWFVGKNKMKNWKAAVSGWESRDKEQSKQRGARQENKNNEKFSNNEWT